MFQLNIDGSTRSTNPNSFWRGFGFISANNSSRLLLDYKAEHPEVYHRILKWLFDPEGAVRMNHIKLEMGADINSSSGTEPSVKRSAEEPADVTRGAGFQLAADALKYNPDITLELLSWGVPGYINNAPDQDKFRLRYLWFKETLDAAYETYGLKFSFIDPNINERAVEREWIKYFSAALKAEKDTPYPYSDIKIVIADEEAHFNAAVDMLRDPALMDAVDVIGVHYISASDENTRCCKKEFGKELWYSEGLAPANVPYLTVNADGCGLSGVNGTLDVAGRIVNMYPTGGYTMYEFQPAVAAYYSGVCYYPKQLIRANEPWSGHIEAGAGLYMAEHFAAFTKKGWQFVDSACFGDGTETDHVLYNTTNNYLTLCDPETGDYTTVFVNHSDKERVYEVLVNNLKKAGEPVHIWETRGPDKGEAYDANYFRHIASVEPAQDTDGCRFRITVKPNSILTASTVNVTAADFTANVPESHMPLPYYDDFEYSDMHGDYLTSRGGTPRYTTDLGGAFEVVPDAERGHVLRQMIREDMKGSEWGYTPAPTTSLGDDCWADITVSADVRLGSTDESCYAGIGLRYINGAAENSLSGYRLIITPGGWQLCRLTRVLAEGSIPGLAEGWHRLSLTAVGNRITCSVDGVQTADIILSGEMTFSGRAALFSSYHNNCFDKLAVEPAGTPYVTRVDDHDSRIRYTGVWKRSSMDSFQMHNRTLSENAGKASFDLTFEGRSLALIGLAEDAVISVWIDGKAAAENCSVRSGTPRSCLWHLTGLEKVVHNAKVTVVSGTVRLDAVEYGTDR